MFNTLRLTLPFSPPETLQDLVSAIEDRGLKIGKAMFQELTGLRKPTLDNNNILHWPVLLLYAEVMSSDFIEDFCETDMFSAHLDMISFSVECFIYIPFWVFFFSFPFGVGALGRESTFRKVVVMNFVYDILCAFCDLLSFQTCFQILVHLCLGTKRTITPVNLLSYTMR